MLTQETIQTVKSTLPLIEEQGPKLTAYFYNRMFRHHPDLKNLFNMSHQRDERQRRALFRAITAYAANIDNVASLLGAVEKIAQKHSNFMLTKRHYDIVGEHLLATIDELLSPGEKVINAWGEAYGVLADIFLNREEEIYQENAQEDGGWRGLREFVVTQKKLESEHITSFVFEPTDGQKVKSYKPGQYIGLYINTPTFENQEIRQYSLSSAVRECSYRISVKREPGGQVSNFLHDEVQEGDKLQLVPPAGDFFIDVTPKTPVTLISAGVGLTPMLSMFESLTTHQPIFRTPDRQKWDYWNGLAKTLGFLN